MGLLTKDEYLATFVEPMQRLEADESYKPAAIGEYVAECIRTLEPPVVREQLQIQHVYLNGNRSFCHVLIHYSQHNRFLVIVVDCNREVVTGHYLLDLNEEYGLDEKALPSIALGDLYVATASEKASRSEAALPGTASVPRLLTLVPPPLDEQLCRSADDDTSRNYGPDPIAEYALVIPARAVFSVPQLSSAITPELMRYFALPTLYVRTPAGRVTYMVSPEGPKQAMEMIAGWNLGKEDMDLVQNIALGAQGLATWLAARPEGFLVVEPDRAEIAGQHQAARRIIEIEPNDVAIVALPRRPGHRFDGQKVWRILHALGLRWGDLDQFQWRDPTDQTDYLFWAEVDDGQFGYALPEEIAAGRQHFDSVQFLFNIARTPHPAHVLQEMARAAEAFAQQLDCQLISMIDRTPADGLQALEVAVRQVGEKLQACGVKPGSSPVCMLR